MVFKRLIAALGAVLVLAGAALNGPAWADPSWSHYSNPGLEVSADFPGAPSVSTEPGGDKGLTWNTTLVQYIQGEDAVFLLSATQYDIEAIPNLGAALDGGIQGMLDAVKATLVSRTDIQVEGNPGADIVATVPSGGYMIRSRLVVRGNRIYMVSALSMGAKPPPGADRFIASLKLSAP